MRAAATSRILKQIAAQVAATREAGANEIVFDVQFASVADTLPGAMDPLYRETASIGFGYTDAIIRSQSRL